jgi:hypothetical protein
MLITKMLILLTMTLHQTVELLSNGLETPQKSIKRWMTMLRYKPGHRWPRPKIGLHPDPGAREFQWDDVGCTSEIPIYGIISYIYGTYKPIFMAYISPFMEL